MQPLAASHWAPAAASCPGPSSGRPPPLAAPGPGLKLASPRCVWLTVASFTEDGLRTNSAAIGFFILRVSSNGKHPNVANTKPHRC